MKGVGNGLWSGLKGLGFDIAMIFVGFILFVILVVFLFKRFGPGATLLNSVAKIAEGISSKQPTPFTRLKL